MKNKHWLLLIGGLLALCLLLSLLLWLPAAPAAAAEIWSEGKLLYTLPLNAEMTLTVTSAYGSNEITVQDGKIAVTHADCPDGYCIQRGWCSGGPEIICLPNRLVIRFKGEQQIDGVVG